MIVLCGLLDEPVLKAFAAYLSYLDHPFLVVDERRLGHEIDVKISVCNSFVSGSISFGNWYVDVDEITGFYNRLGMGEEDSAQPDINQYQRLRCLLQLFDGPVANRPHSIESNGSKLCQFPAILRSGLSIPDTFSGMSHSGLHRFEDHCPVKIVKSVSSIRSKVKPVHTNDIAVLPEYILPHQYQERLIGRNIRVHVVDDVAFACEADTTALDYRYPRDENARLKLVPLELPPHIVSSCVRLTHDLGLGFSGIDLFRSSSGKWYCFEVNTCPGYTWFERNSGLPISAALHRYLSGGRKSEREKITD